MRNIFAVLSSVLFGLIIFTVSVSAETVVEPFTYHEDFETKELSAWASYPLWQDTAYDPNTRVNTVVPGDPNISFEQIVTPYSNVDNYAGAQKELDMYLVPGSTISLRYYLKTSVKPEFFKIRLAAGKKYKKIDVTVYDPPVNEWVWMNVDFTDFLRENPIIAGTDQVPVNAIAVLAKFPDADPAMPIYLGLDDITFKGARTMAFQFAEPTVHKLSEWKPYISATHYSKGDTFNLSGTWPLDADRVTCSIVNYTNHDTEMVSTTLSKKGSTWTLKPFKLNYEPGLYLGTLKAEQDGEILAETEFTLYIAPDIQTGVHPRLWYDADRKPWVKERFLSDRFSSVRESIVSGAKRSRDSNPVEELEFDIDQFPNEKWLIGDRAQGWFNRISGWRSALHNNALAYDLDGDREAGIYCKDLMVKLAEFPYWLHPWMIKRGRNIYYPVGELGMEYALAYDLVYDLMTDAERAAARDAMMRNIVMGAHKGYVEDDLVTSNTSNWVAHITGGSLMCQAAMYNDGPEYANVEPYFTGAIMKDYELIQYVLDSEGAYGEGYGYFNFTMLSLSKTCPALENVFNVDMSAKLNGSYKELIWAGNIHQKQTYYFGDSSGSLRPLTNFAWLLPKYRDPLLGWFYNYMKTGETFMDVLYETEDVPMKEPFDEPPVKLFREVGTTVFRGGWDEDDFIFVLRTGPFVNHQHLDQGTFWLADRGSLFIEERHGSTYYKDPEYQPWYTQPVGHSTILIDNNHQSQRVGDLLHHVEGFDDYAYVTHFLDGTQAAFVQGDIGRLYWGKVESMQRNVLYLKPDTIIMVDTITPGKRDIDVSLLYQTTYLDEITPSGDSSSITIDGNSLHIQHLTPENCNVQAIQTPHYLSTLLNDKPLRKQGMLTVNARTDRVPLVMANLLTVTDASSTPSITSDITPTHVVGNANGQFFAVNRRPGSRYYADTLTTDALVITEDGENIFAGMCTVIEHDGKIIINSDIPITCELSSNTVNYYSCTNTTVQIAVKSKPSSITINGSDTKSFEYDATHSLVTVNAPGGNGTILMIF